MTSLEAKVRRKPRKTIDHLPDRHWYDKVNKTLASGITSGVGTMWCAYLFAAIALTSLPSVLAEHSVNADVQWVAQTFLQLVLLSVIIVGQNIQSDAADARAERTYEDTVKIIDALDTHTKGGLTEVLDAVRKIPGAGE